MRVFEVEEIRRLDRLTIEEFGLPSHSLMEVAGHKVYNEIKKRFDPIRSAFVMCGHGNNGGDGLVIARLLLISGAKVVLLFAGDSKRWSPDLVTNYKILKSLSRHTGNLEEYEYVSADIEDLKKRILDSDLIVDALLGTGIKSELKDDYGDLVAFINSLSISERIVAVDIPSGLNGDSGSPLPEAIKAKVTITIGGGKIGLYSYPAPEYTGEVVVVDIGLPLSLASAPLLEVTDPDIYRGHLKRRDMNFHKGDGGHTAILAGSADKRGAAYISVLGSLRVGTGLVTLISIRDVVDGITQIYPEVMTRSPDFSRLDDGYYSDILAGINTLVIGPGLGLNEDVIRWTKRLIDTVDKFMVLDADALSFIKGKRFRDNRVVLTPHPLELSRMLGISKDEIQRDRPSAAKMTASQFNAVCVLKGARTVIAAPDGRVTINTTGNPLMASGGMGDLLSGIIGGLIYQSSSVYDAARIGVYIHGLAADIVAQQRLSPLIASDLAGAISEAVKISHIYE